MRILYGVQGTGNGHTTRARAMAPALAAEGLEVDYLFSGREAEDYFDMEPFGDYALRSGLTMVIESGQIKVLKTLAQAAPLSFIREVRNLDVSPYDLILTDFEPVTAWAGNFSQVPVLGLGHQYAFRYPIPQHRGGLHQRMIMKYFAPAKQALGFHWHHFDMPILPPIAPVQRAGDDKDRDLIVVYLPFEDPQDIEKLLAPYKRYRFVVYHPLSRTPQQDHVQWHLPSRDKFHQHLVRCNGVLCNAGFELTSEVLQLGCKLLVKPVRGQSEQISNAIALRHIGLGYSMSTLDAEHFDEWLGDARGVKVKYPDVARAVAKWIVAGDHEDNSNLAAMLWRKTRFPDKPLFDATDADPYFSRPG